mmetsp:Transcript_12715/g.14453  ORF Transcript_12715/g.14453 Transcript_12715/m.14453 type:complete len:287 (+) Transcript_12715:91-951(+)
MEVLQDISKASVDEIEALIQSARQEIAKIELELLREIEEENQVPEETEKPEFKDPKDKDIKDKENGTANLECKTAKDDLNANKEKQKDDTEGIWKPPAMCIPMRGDVRSFDFEKLIREQKRATGKLFDVIMTDPPWQLATSNPTRGVAIGYQQLSDTLIEAIPFGRLQENGFIFIWVINAKYRFALDLMERWGYNLIDEVVWVKSTVNRRLAKSHGFYLQHAKETCLVGKKGGDPPNCQHNVDNDVIYSVRRGQSQKPIEIYRKFLSKCVSSDEGLTFFFFFFRND